MKTQLLIILTLFNKKDQIYFMQTDTPVYDTNKKARIAASEVDRHTHTHTHRHTHTHTHTKVFLK